MVIKTANEPGFLGKYKLSHVFDSGENFEVDGKVFTGKADKELSELYYDIGHSDDYLKNTDKIRKTNIDNCAKKVIVAKFLRFAHPFNYFLTPSKKLHRCEEKVFMNDIGEDPRMISYVKSYLEKTFPDEYAEFIKKILWYENIKNPKEDGSTVIKITYTNTKIKKANDTPKKESKNSTIFKLIKKYITTKNISSFDELNLEFPKIASLISNIKDSKRYFEEVITLLSGEKIRITNQIGDGPKIPQNRNYTSLLGKFSKNGIACDDI